MEHKVLPLLRLYNHVFPAYKNAYSPLNIQVSWSFQPTQILTSGEQKHSE